MEIWLCGNTKVIKRCVVILPSIISRCWKTHSLCFQNRTGFYILFFCYKLKLIYCMVLFSWMLLGGTEAICCVVVMFCYRTAWKQLEDMSAEQAMQEYVSCVTSLDPDSSQKVKSPHKSNNTLHFIWYIYIIPFPTAGNTAIWELKQMSCSHLNHFYL